jgi:dihydrofolate reductase
LSKVQLFIATSIDGYLATLDDDLQWLDSIEGDGDQGFQLFYDQISGIMMGRKTYEILCNLVGDYPHRDRKTFVFSNTVEINKEEIQTISGDVNKCLDEVRSYISGNVWLVGGGELCRQFLNADLVDELILTIAPLNLGSGIPLWGEMIHPIHWRLEQVTQYHQFVQLKYMRKRVSDL